MTMALITLAGAVGCLVRYALELATRHRHPTMRPWGTVAANALGCLIAGYVVYAVAGAVSPRWHDVLTTGFCGGLTTFSSAFAVPALLAREHHPKYAVALVVTTPLVCAATFAFGAFLPHP
jgi:CrcB protein